MELKKKRHFLGMGGIGMSALAHLLLEKGDAVSGSDQKSSLILDSLIQKGARLNEWDEQAALVYSSAIKADHPLIKKAKDLKIPLYHRSELLKELMQEKKGLLVAGTHGKTSTSALLAWTLLSSKLEPSYAVGGILNNTAQNGGYGKGDYFVAEADESDGSFLAYHGEAAILTNLEKEHLDHWKTEDQLISGFQTFAGQNKTLFSCGDDPLLSQLKLPGIRYGASAGCDYRLSAFRQEPHHAIFSIEGPSHTFSDIQLPSIGRHQAFNATAVWALALSLGLSEKEVRRSFASYKGVQRRLEKKGEVGDVTIYDDYAHHPTEIEAVLTALRLAVKEKEIIAIFEPHRYTRTRDFFTLFTKAFKAADRLYLLPIYPAGETPLPGITSQKLAAATAHATSLTKEQLLETIRGEKKSVIVTIGAGDVTELGPQILQVLR